MARAALIVSLVSVVIVSSLIGVVLFQQFEILSLQRKNEESFRVSEVSSSFLVRDGDFTLPISQNAFWEVEAWNRNPDSLCEIVDGVLHLFYNGTSIYTYGNSGVLQGRHADGRFTDQSLLIGSSPEDSFTGEYVVFPRNLSSDKLWLETKFKIVKMGFNSFPSTVNLGMTLMCAINNQPFNLEAQTLWLDVYFAGYFLNRTNVWVVPKNVHYENYQDGDVHAGYYVNEVQPLDFGEWVELSVDFGDYIRKTLNLITRVNVKTIRVYGFLLFVECLGAYAEAEYDYIKIYIT